MLSWTVLEALSWLEQFDAWLRDIAMHYGYLGIFVTSLIGAMSIVIPIPYTVLIFLMGKILNPVLVALSAGAGATLGEFFGYLMGYYGRAVISEERKRKVDYILKVFSRYGALTIFAFALTPLPDDLLFIPLGIMRYSFIKAFVPCLIGKFLMSLILAYGGAASIGFIEAIFGGEGGGVWMMIFSAVLLFAVIVIMLRVDWEKLLPMEKGKKN